MALPVTTFNGNIVAKPEFNTLPDGSEVMNFTLAANYRKKGEDKAMFIRVAQFNPRRSFADHLDKGSLVSVAGEFEVTAYLAKDGTPRASVDVRAFDSGINFVGGRSSNSNSNAPQTSNAPEKNDLPF